ncbi:alpha-E domain-containing protein [Roseomonas sp. CCTCC AB2023176]|uniref:alpha-E domain-containing protein n=1 Tax=Roseomonas sp. CCTCC AB2023176 TaxID=3342640 RepID=UPI0035DFBB1C
MPGGLARVVGGGAKDVWVLAEERAEIRGPGALRLPALAIRRTAGDLPSRVADNLFWLGRYVERLDDAARMMRATIARLERAPMLPRDAAELRALSRCLLESKILRAEDGTEEAGLRAALRRASEPGGQLIRLTDEVSRLVEASRDRLTNDMHAAFTGPLREARAALRVARTEAGLAAALGLLVRYASGVAGVAAENMVRGGAHAFLDLGRRMERAACVAGMLGQVLAEPPSRVESGLTLALELCDSVITYRNRYLHVLQPAPSLDLVIADPANPRGLAFQLAAAESLLSQVEGAGDAVLSGTAGALREAAEAMAAEVVGAGDGAVAAVALSKRLLALEEAVSDLSDGVGRRYFTLLAAPQRLGVDTAEAVRGAA